MARCSLSHVFLVSLAVFLPGPLSARLYLAPSDKLTLSDDYDRLSYPKDSGQKFAYWEVKGVVASTGQNYTAHVALLSGGLLDTFSYSLPAQGELFRSLPSTVIIVQWDNEPSRFGTSNCLLRCPHFIYSLVVLQFDIPVPPSPPS